MFLTNETNFGLVKNFLAMYSALNGSPGIKTILAISPLLQLKCGVGIVTPKYQNVIVFIIAYATVVT